MDIDPLDALRASGLNPIVIDENTDFSKLPLLQPETKSFKIEVIADATGTWSSNGVAFNTYAEAQDYGKDLSARWTLVTDMRVIESSEEPSYTFTGGVLRALNAKDVG